MTDPHERTRRDTSRTDGGGKRAGCTPLDVVIPLVVGATMVVVVVLALWP